MNAVVIFPPNDFAVELSPAYTFRAFIREYPDAHPLIYKGMEVWTIPALAPEAKYYTQFPREGAEGEDVLLQDLVFARCKAEGRISYESP